MNMTKIITTAILSATATAALLGGVTPASAQVILDLQNPYQVGNVGDTFQFFGTVTNYGPMTTFLTGDNYTSLPAGVTLDDSPLFNAPSLLTAGGTAGSTYTGELFDITVAPGTTPGFYSGLFTLTGGTDPVADQYKTLNTNGFSVAAVPEASSLVSFGLLMLGGVGTVVFGRFQARRRTA